MLSLVIPDKRFCFDYFQQISTTGQLVDAFLRKAVQPTPGQILDHHLNASASAGRIAWAETDALAKPDSLVHRFDEAKSIFKNSILDGKYVDVHCWKFTPESFELVIKDLINLDLIALNFESLSTTNGCEFYASFVRDNSVSPSISNRSRFELLNFICKA